VEVVEFMEVKMKFSTGSQPDKEYEKGYQGSLDGRVKSKCRGFSEAYFKCNKGFGRKDADKATIKREMQEIKDQLIAVDGNDKELLDYFGFLILNKGNYEFMIPYYKICEEIGEVPPQEIVIRHDNHTFGLMGTVDEILAD
jgi:hypothetical protein